jgi:hypothetical protein
MINRVNYRKDTEKKKPNHHGDVLSNPNPGGSNLGDSGVHFLGVGRVEVDLGDGLNMC